MTPEEILAMEAGKGLDIRVAEDVVGCKFVTDEIFGDIQIYDDGAWTPLQPYSQDKAAALLLSEELQQCYHLEIDFDRLAGRWEANLGRGGINYYFPELRATSLPEAVCKVALLLARREEQQRVNSSAPGGGMEWLDGLVKKRTGGQPIC